MKNNPDVYNYFINILQSNKNDDFLPAYKLFVESDNYILNFSNFNIPTLIMTGENEVGSYALICSRMLHQKIKNSKLYIIPNAKHMAAFEEANLVNTEIAKFII